MPKSNNRVMTMLVSLRRLGYPVPLDSANSLHAELHYGDSRSAPMEGGILYIPYHGETHMFRYLGRSRFGPLPQDQPHYVCKDCGSADRFIDEPGHTPCGFCGSTHGWTLPIEFLFERV